MCFCTPGIRTPYCNSFACRQEVERRKAEKKQEELFFEARRVLRELTDNQRKQLFSLFCTHCGSKDLPCFCCRDE